jgi:hypothetical protein
MGKPKDRATPRLVHNLWTNADPHYLSRPARLVPPPRTTADANDGIKVETPNLAHAILDAP